MTLFVAKLVVGLTSLIYFALSIWCSLQPEVTSHKVGFELRGGSGQSEFLTVYGGLEFGLALILAATLWQNETVIYGLWVSTLIHGSLVIFRTIAFFRFSDFESFTYRLAVGEWIILAITIILLVMIPRQTS